ncbi:penicillin-binding protein 2 [Glaciihabitans sp. UYNi722]|uniref:peptidoglycan D,D-transpeptidase FtsI family protein n=1 Tax=Glaciihabitans sp. UYNi722 TaxID=3156344 RepID=UPI0033930815
MNNPRMNRRRLALSIVVVFVVVAVFAGRLVDIQLVRADQLNKDSLSKRAIAAVTYAPRGQIIDSNGVILADTVTRYDVTASPRTMQGGFDRKAKNGTVTKVSLMDVANEIATITKQDPSAVYLSLSKNPKSDYAVVSKTVDTTSMRAIRALKIPGLYFPSHPIRTYPTGAVAGNLTGYMNTDGAGGGLELGYDKSCLASANGTSTYERGEDGVQIPGSTVTKTAAKPGGTLKLTIDDDLQFFTDQAIAQQATAIGATSATAIVFRIKDAHIMAMSDWPNVDPNNVDGTPIDNVGSLAFTAQYEPGSTFKAMSAAILIDTGKATPTTPGVTVPSAWKTPEGGMIHDAGAHAPERLTLTGVLQQSSNVGISMLGSTVSPSVRYDYMKKFGLGEKTAVNFLGEASGSLAKHWDDQTKYNVLYGQGVSATLPQLAGIFQTIGNGGVRLPLTLVEGCTHPDGTVTDLPQTAGARVVAESSAKTVVNMLESVVTGGELSRSLQIPGYRVAAKSGTAEVAEHGVYSSDRIVSLAGLAPAENPQYGVIVTYTKPVIMKSSAAAAPTFQKIMTEVLTKYRVSPSTTPSTSPATNW